MIRRGVTRSPSTDGICKSRSRYGYDFDQLLLEDWTMPTLAVYHTKGGVGKTATAVNLAYLAAQSGAHTLLCDLDPQSAATFYFRVKPKLTSGSKTFIKG